MKTEWTKILAESDQEDVTQGRQPGIIDSNVHAGDERDDGDVLSKLKERRYRIGESENSYALEVIKFSFSNINHL